jgi:putative ABC transport system permease protein
VLFGFFRALKFGFKSLLMHKLRSGLAMLGILIGVTAVIWLVALGEGVSYQAQQQIKELGATNIIIKSVKPSIGGGTGGSPLVIYGLKWTDYDKIIRIPTVKAAVPMREIRRKAYYGQQEAKDIQFVGCTPEYFAINRLEMDRGRFITDRDVDRIDNVAVLASSTAEYYFPYENPIGKSIQIDTDFYTIVGVTKNRQATASIGGSFEGREYNWDIYTPLSTIRARIGDQVNTSTTGGLDAELVELNQITITVDDIKNVEATARIVEILLQKDKGHLLSADYSVTVPKELLKQAEMVRMMFNVLLVLIAGISLVVGGIGIMNIMLATVTERTREIGIRRALGAKRWDITVQFLAETVVLSAVGGLLGVAFGFLCGSTVDLVKWAFEAWMPDSWNNLPPTIKNLEPMIATWSVMVAFGISVGVGVLFGLYPARRAARMDPIEALRHE